jgi:hypothetical protein
MDCSVRFTDPCDLAEWVPYIQQDAVRITNELLADKPTGSSTREARSSCRPDQFSFKDSTINFQDFNIDIPYGSTHHLYNEVQENEASFLALYVDCNGSIYGFEQDANNEYAGFSFGLDQSHVIPQRQTESQRIEGTLNFQHTREYVPFSIPGLVELLLENQAYNSETSAYGDYTTPCPN